MTAPDLKTLKVKMRGEQGSGKTEFLSVLAHVARGLGMTTWLEEDGHNMRVISTKEQRVKLFELNRKVGGVDALIEGDEGTPA